MSLCGGANLDATTPALESGALEDDFELAYRTLWAGMVRLAWAMVGSRPVAEDVVQDAFLKAQARWSGVESPRAYLRAAVVNGVRARQRRRLLELNRQLFSDAPVTSPEVDEVWALLLRLPPRQRDALALRYYEDLSLEEVAHLLRCPLGTAKSLIHRGLAALRKDLGP